MTEYRIEFTITARGPDDDDFAEVGFGSTGAWATTKAALNDLDAIVDNYEWETTAGMPDPKGIKRAEEYQE